MRCVRGSPSRRTAPARTRPTASVWSPAPMSWSTSHSREARAPLRTGQSVNAPGCGPARARARAIDVVGAEGADEVEAVGERLQRLDDGVALDLAVHCANKYRGRWKRVSISIEGRPCGQDGLRRQGEPPTRQASGAY